MPFVYVLRSLKNSKRYVGSTVLNPKMRLNKHNSGSNQFTKRNRPFILIYQEEYQTITDARKRENYLKSGVGRNFLDKILN